MTLAEVLLGPVARFEKRPEVWIAFFADQRQDIIVPQLVKANGEDKNRRFVPEFGQARKGVDVLRATHRTAPAADFRIPALIAREVAHAVTAVAALALLHGHFHPLGQLLFWRVTKPSQQFEATWNVVEIDSPDSEIAAALVGVRCISRQAYRRIDDALGVVDDLGKRRFDEDSDFHGMYSLWCSRSELFVGPADETYPDATGDEGIDGECTADTFDYGMTPIIDGEQAPVVFVGVDEDIDAVGVHTEASNSLCVDHDVLRDQMSLGFIIDMECRSNDFRKCLSDRFQNWVRNEIRLVSHNHEWHGVLLVK